MLQNKIFNMANKYFLKITLINKNKNLQSSDMQPKDDTTFDYAWNFVWNSVSNTILIKNI